MVKILDKTNDSILVKLPLSMEKHIKSLSNGFDTMSPAEKRSIQSIKRAALKSGYITHQALYEKYFSK